ncbi:MAG TPA: secondary thiamine-phosphate synthase enzyme YjbQ [Tepidisphaeraceae bacterium]|jgi:secondary thiamine-phosphate synthase enzyme
MDKISNGDFHMRGIKLDHVTFQTQHRNEMVELTARVQQGVTSAGVGSGMAVVFVAHTTAAITINENADPDVKTDLLRKLETLIPQNETYYQHDEGNSDSHLKASLVGQSVTVLIEQGRLQLGRWQGIYLCEFDGPRERRVLLKLVSFDEG